METANFGTFLREERERRNVSLAEISRSTKLSVSSLKLMEDGNLDDLPPDVFVRGFIRSYAKTLGISSSEPLGMLDQTLTERRRDPMSPSAVLVESPARGRKPEAARLLPSEPTGEDEVPVPHRGIGLPCSSSSSCSSPLSPCRSSCASSRSPARASAWEVAICKVAIPRQPC